jgi:hypothetical protein
MWGLYGDGVLSLSQMDFGKLVELDSNEFSALILLQ